jgi:hypothetical protein
MLEYLLSLYFIVLGYFILKNQSKKPSFELKAIELAMIIYITYKHPLLGLACTMIALRQTIEPMVSYTLTPFRLPVEEQMRPKCSNIMNIERSHGLPPQESITGQMARPYKNEPNKKYTPF